MPVIVSPVASYVTNPDDTRTLTSSVSPQWYQNDSALWVPVVWADPDNLPGNCQFVPIDDGYRMWKPNGLPPYNPQWLPTDYWLQVEDEAGVTDFSPRRTTAIEQVRLTSGGSTWPTWKWTWNSNLTHRVVGARHEWVSADGVVQFTKLAPSAWSESDPTTVVTGTAALDQNGYVTLDIDLSSLNYPIILDPTTAFAPTAGDGFIDSFKAATYQDSDWPSYRAGSYSFDVQYGGSSGQWAEFIPGTELNRGYSAHDTSAIGAGSIVSAASFTARCVNHYTTTSTTIDVVQGAQASVTQLTSADWGTVGTVSGGSIACSALTNGADFTITFNATGLGFISLTGNTKLAFKLGIDFSDSTFPSGAGNTGTTIVFGEGATPPSLSVTYAAGGGGSGAGRRKAMRSAQMIP